MKLSTVVILVLLVVTSAFGQTPAPAPGEPPPQAGSETHRHAEAPVAPAGGEPATVTFPGLLGVAIGAVLLMGMLAMLAFSSEKHPPRHA